MRQLRTKKFRQDAILPTRANPTDAGLDLYALDYEVLQYGTRVTLRTGIGIALSPGTVGLIKDRSSMSNKGVHALGGVIDANYRGEIQVTLAVIADSADYSDADVIIHPGDKIAQLVIVAIYTPEVFEVEELETTDRNTNGFGSTGR